MVLVISTEPYLLIDAASRSPFNVTPPLQLEAFSHRACCELNEKYGSPLAGEEIDQLYRLLDGHPYLTRLAFYRLIAADHIAFSELMARADDSDGPFGDHLRAILVKLSTQPELLDAMRQIVAGSGQPRKELCDRLRGAGYITSSSQGLAPANELYARFFGRML
jgi:hypothetical protein